ncbi:MAG: putative lipid II flippase FtsW [Spirochaetota bacterium]
MNSFAVERVEKKQPMDTVLLAVIVLLATVGVSMLFSSSYFRAQRLFDDPLYFFRRQALWVLLGAAAATLAARISLTFIQKQMRLILGATLVLMLLTFVPGIGTEFLGARRWIFIFGYSFQPSELAKLTVVIYLAFILSKKQDRMDDPVNALLPPIIVVAVFASLIYVQNDFSTGFFLVFIALAMLFVANVPLRYFMGLGVMMVPLAVILLLSREHRVKRLVSYLEPARDPTGTGYQVFASNAALRAGGLWGEGIGGSVQKAGRLPEAHSDFVFAILAEELGFAGVLLIVSLFGMLAYRGYLIAYTASDRFTSLVAFGLTSTVCLQALFNLAVVAGAVPATGVPLPFFSSGGTSVFMTLVMCGLLLNVSRFTERRGGELHG